MAPGSSYRKVLKYEWDSSSQFQAFLTSGKRGLMFACLCFLTSFRSLCIRFSSSLQPWVIRFEDYLTWWRLSNRYLLACNYNCKSNCYKILLTLLKDCWRKSMPQNITSITNRVAVFFVGVGLSLAHINNPK